VNVTVPDNGIGILSSVCVCVWGWVHFVALWFLNKSNQITSPFLNANREQDNYG
jgi:hypothetical protein